MQWCVCSLAGVLLGYSSRLALGCNVGTMVSAAADELGNAAHGHAFAPQALAALRCWASAEVRACSSRELRSINNLRPSKVSLAFFWLITRQDFSEVLKRGNSIYPALSG
ncbi:MAG: hypothetical protein I8H77_01380 [Comamonadaceae bacterium]|nr:hypothetical protein [Comamonadaceae bacterium]